MKQQSEHFETIVASQSVATVYVDLSVYSKGIVLKACNWYTDVAYIQIAEVPEGKLSIQLTLKEPFPTLDNPQQTSVHKVCGELCNSILDFALRRQIEVETAAVRQLILAKAFSEAGILEDEPPGEISDPVDLRKKTTESSTLIRIANTA